MSLSIIVCLDIICHVNKSVHCEKEVHPDYGFSDFHSIHGSESRGLKVLIFSLTLSGKPSWASDWVRQAYFVTASSFLAKLAA